jgi:hypothetical protein
LFLNSLDTQGNQFIVSNTIEVIRTLKNNFRDIREKFLGNKTNVFESIDVIMLRVLPKIFNTT